MTGKYFVLFLPLIFSYAFYESPVISYFIAWGGSFWIFYFALSGRLKPLPDDYSLLEQAMRPIVLPHIIFAGYMASTSVFYFVSQLGYVYFEKDPGFYVDDAYIMTLAQCQRYYLAGHIFFVLGILSYMKYNFKPKYTTFPAIDRISYFMMWMTFYFFILSFVARFIPGLSQTYLMMVQITSVASIISFAFALPEKKPSATLISGFLFFTSYISAIASGWKEAILVPLITLGVYLYPNYKKIIWIIGPIALFTYFYFVPTFNGIVRGQSWSGQMDGLSASSYAFTQIASGEADISSTNWEFLTGRLSEIKMFAIFVQKIPNEIDHYGLKISIQGLESIIPRVFYPNKPITELMVMQRVVEIGVVESGDAVSAKPALVADAYISGGLLGVIITCYLFGLITSWVSVKAEELFGSYILGSGLIFTGLFQVLWRGNCFEFMFNSVVWSIITMFALHKLALSFNMVTKISVVERYLRKHIKRSFTPE